MLNLDAIVAIVTAIVGIIGIIIGIEVHFLRRRNEITAQKILIHQATKEMKALQALSENLESLKAAGKIKDSDTELQTREREIREIEKYMENTIKKLQVIREYVKLSKTIESPNKELEEKEIEIQRSEAIRRALEKAKSVMEKEKEITQSKKLDEKGFVEIQSLLLIVPGFIALLFAGTFAYLIPGSCTQKGTPYPCSQSLF